MNNCKCKEPLLPIETVKWIADQNHNYYERLRTEMQKPMDEVTRMAHIETIKRFTGIE